MTEKTIGKDSFPARAVSETAINAQTPFYIYDEKAIAERCRLFVEMEGAFGHFPRYAIKAHPGRAILELINSTGMGFDASSLNEVRRAIMAGIQLEKIMLTSQEIHRGLDEEELVSFIQKGLKYNICSVRQLERICKNPLLAGIPFGIRINPGFGSGESASRNTGDKYSSFGIHLSALPKALETAGEASIFFETVHVHIGSGGEPEAWEANIDRQLDICREFFPDAKTVNFGGGFRVARMPDEKEADIKKLFSHAKKRLKDFHKETGRKLLMETEPGTFIMANSGYLVTRVMDIKSTGPDGFVFILLDGGMEVNSRPLLYGSRHPFFILDNSGKIIFDEFDNKRKDVVEAVLAGRCCESGDSFTLDREQKIQPRQVKMPRPGDLLVIGGSGAYCSSMSPFNYNSHQQAAEYMLKADGTVSCIRKRQSVEQIVENETSLLEQP